MGQEEIAKLKEKREEWLRWYDGDDRHAIKKQIHGMLWDAAVFYVVNKARSYVPETKKGEVNLNSTLHEFINRCYYQSQVLAIRRLTEKDKRKQKDIISLRRLVDDMEQNREILTRENMLHVEGLTYDFESIRDAWTQKRCEEILAGKREPVIPPKYDWSASDMRHKQINQLVGVTADNRHPSDSVLQKVFQTLKEMLEVGVCEDLIMYSHKYVAHAATQNSRSGVCLKRSLDELYRAQENICKVANFIIVHLLGGAELSFLPDATHDLFRYMDRPLISKPDLQRLATDWNEYKGKVNQWLREYEEMVLSTT